MYQRLHSRHLRSVRALLLAAALAGALIGVLFASQHASAYGTIYCSGWMPPNGTCVGPQHTLTANTATDDTGSNGWVCNIAQYPGGSYYGGWGCSNGQSENCYPGNQLLKGEILDAAGTWLYMHGIEYYGQGCP